MTRHIRRALLLSSAALLSACASDVPEVRLLRPPLPAYLLTPPPRPPLPDPSRPLTQGDVAELLVMQDAAIEGYERRLMEIARLDAAAAAATTAPR